MRKHGPRALGLCLLAALSLMAIGVATAQAGIPQWKIGGVTLKGTETVSGVQKPGTEFLFESLAGKASIVIHCKKLITDDGLMVGNEKVPRSLGSATRLFSECVTLLNGGVNSICKPVEPIEPKSKTLLILHEGKTYILFEPFSGSTFVEIKFGTGECSIPTTPIQGAMIYQCLNEKAEQLDCAVEQVERTLAPASSTLFVGQSSEEQKTEREREEAEFKEEKEGKITTRQCPTPLAGNKLPQAQGLHFGANSATLSGIAIVKLIGVNKGQKWGGFC